MLSGAFEPSLGPSCCSAVVAAARRAPRLSAGTPDGRAGRGGFLLVLSSPRLATTATGSAPSEVERAMPPVACMGVGDSSWGVSLLLR